MLKLKKYSDVIVGEELEMPDIVELIISPFFYRADLEDMYKYGNSITRYFIDKIPLKNNTKYVTGQWCVQFLTPNVISVPRGNWHADTNDYEYQSNEFTTHLITSKSTAMTEFIDNDIVLKDFDENSKFGDIEIYLNHNHHIIKPKKADPNRFITFTNHFHRATRAEKPEFRFMFRVIENNSLTPLPIEQSLINYSSVFIDNIKYEDIDMNYIENFTPISKISIIKEQDKIIVNTNYM